MMDDRPPISNRWFIPSRTNFRDQGIADTLVRRSQAQVVALDLEAGIPDDDVADVGAYWD